jgi:hypothetical protein
MPGYVLPEIRGGVLRVKAALMFREYSELVEKESWAADWAHAGWLRWNVTTQSLLGVTTIQR